MAVILIWSDFGPLLVFSPTISLILVFVFFPIIHTLLELAFPEHCRLIQFRDCLGRYGVFN